MESGNSRIALKSVRAVAIAAYLAVICFALMHYSDNKADVDLWGNIGFVRTLPWQNGYHFINTFSFTEPNHPWINHEWLGEYILNFIYRQAGNTGLICFKLLVGFIIVAALNWSMKKSGASGYVRFLMLIVIISVSGYGFSVRPHLFTYLAIIIFLYLFKHRQNRPLDYLLLLPLLGLFWTNAHGAFFIGILIAVVNAFFNLRTGKSSNTLSLLAMRAALLLPLLLIAVSFITPYGKSLWNFIQDSAGHPRPYLSEWRPILSLEELADHADFVVLAAFSLVIVILGLKHISPLWLTYYILALAAALLMRRNIPIFAFVCAFAIPEAAEKITGTPLKRISFKLRGFTLTLLLLISAISLWFTVSVRKTRPDQIEIQQDRFPVDTISFIKANDIEGNLLSFMDWAEYGIWKLYPKCRVFLDGRFRSAYSAQTIADYLAFIYGAPNGESVLEKHNVDMVLIHLNNPANQMMKGKEGWTAVWQDQCGILYLRNAVHSEFLHKIISRNAVFPEKIQTAFFP